MQVAAGAIDGELLIMRERHVQSFNTLQQRLNRTPAHLRAYDFLFDNEGDVRDRPFVERRARLEALIGRALDLSAIVRFATWQELAAARDDPAAFGAGEDAQAIEGVMLKRRDGPYLPGRPKGPWWKWKRGPILIDAVLMYAQRGHGKRSSFYSDYTFGVWRGGPDGGELVPVGKAISVSPTRSFFGSTVSSARTRSVGGGAPAGPGPCTRGCIRKTATLPPP